MDSFYGLKLDEEQRALVSAIRGGSGFARYLEHFRGQEKCAVCKLTTNHRGWISSFADALEE